MTRYDFSAETGPSRLAPRAGRPLVSVVVPAYNEDAIITDSLVRLTEYMASLGDLYRWEILVVNDGSTDATGELAEAFAACHPGVRVLQHRVNFQLGQALRYAFNTCRGDYVVVIDCDLSYAPEHIGRLLYTIQDTQARIVIASPYLAGGQTTNVPFLRRVSSRWANRMLALTAAGNLSTITGMVRVYDGRFLRTLDLKAMDSEINTEIVYKAQILRARIVEIPAHLDWSFHSTGGNRRRANRRLSRSTASSIFSAFIFRPFVFFVLPGLVLLAVSLYTFGWVVWHVVDVYGQKSAFGNTGFTGAVQNAYQQAPHTFLITGITLVLSIQLMSLGIVAAQSKRFFEELFHLGTSIYRQLRPWEPGHDAGAGLFPAGEAAIERVDPTPRR